MGESVKSKLMVFALIMLWMLVVECAWQIDRLQARVGVLEKNQQEPPK